MISSTDLQKMILEEIYLFIEESKKDITKPQDIKPFLDGNKTAILKRVEEKLKVKVEKTE